MKSHNLTELYRAASGTNPALPASRFPGNAHLKASLDLWIAKGEDCGGPLTFEDWATRTICGLVEVNNRQLEQLADLHARRPVEVVMPDPAGGGKQVRRRYSRPKENMRFIDRDRWGR